MISRLFLLLVVILIILGLNCSDKPQQYERWPSSLIRPVWMSTRFLFASTCMPKQLPVHMPACMPEHNATDN